MGQLKRLPFSYCIRSERLICNKNLFSLLIGLIFLIHPVFSEFTTIHSFNGGTNDGSSPHGSLILAGSTLYGMTYEGGNGMGAIFKVETDGSEFTLLHKFSGGIDGQNPFGSLILSGSTLYGMTYGAMPSEYGTIFKIQTDGSGYSILHKFAGGASDGANPRGSLLLSGSTLYGVTLYGGVNNDGTIFKIETDGADFALLHDFSILSYDGRNPRGSLIISGSTLYGTTFSGANGGTIFKIETDGSNYSIIFTLSSSTLPGDLILIDSNLYGMMLGSASSTEGMIFKVQTDGTGYTSLHNFTGGSSDGAKPYGSLCLSNSTLYGMTSAGGDANLGTIFKIETDGSSYAVLREFSESGANRPEGSLIISGSTLYGMTPTSGYVGLGTIFSFTPPSVRVTSPNGGENWIANSMHDITWTSFEVNDVDIDYSTDGGSTWASVADNITNNGVYSWTIPNSPSSACLVRVQEYDAIPTDKSDLLFSINNISITGTILVNASPLSGVVLSGLPGDPVTDSSGHYNASVSYNWSGTVLPTLAGYSFSPTNRNYTNVVIDQAAQDYAATLITHTISGTVLLGGSPLAGVVMSGMPGDPVTDASGVYSGTITYGWSGTVTPTLAGYTFSPAFREYSGVASDQTSQDFTATRITFPISGTITAYGYGLADVTMDGLPGTITTDFSGAYSGTVDYGWSGTVTPSKTCYSFTPVSRDYASVTSSQTSQDYTALCTMAIPQIEREALIALYNSTNGNSWTNKTGWKTPPLHSDGFALPGTEGTWYGITITGNSVSRISENNNNLVGILPIELGNLANLIEINLNSNTISGTIPTSLGSLVHLQKLWLASNKLTGSIPSELGNLINLQWLYLSTNLLTGSISPEIGNLSNLGWLYLEHNQLSGEIPPEIGNLTKLSDVRISHNQFSGSIPEEIGNLKGLLVLGIGYCKLTGPIPVTIGNLTGLGWLGLQGNQLSGSIPEELGNIALTYELSLNSNQLTGEIPPSLINLNTNLINIGYNSLYTNDVDLIAFLNGKDPDWAATQTIAPNNVVATPLNSMTISLTWDAIPYVGDTGGYRVSLGTEPGGPYAFFAQTADKSVTTMDVNGLSPLKDYYFIVQTRTDAHGDQQNLIDSDNSAEVSATTLAVHTVTFVEGTNGTIIGTKVQMVDHGASCAAVAAVPNTGYYFVEWTGDYSGTDNPLTIDNVLSDMTITANFVGYTYTVSGTVTFESTPLEGVTINGLPGSPVSNSSGYYTTTVGNGWSGTATPVKQYFSFTPASVTYDIVNSDKTTDYTASLNQSLIVTSPAAGELWERGLTYSIQWLKQGTQNANVKIQLFKGATLVKTITSTTANDGQYDWKVPTDIAPANSYFIRVKTVDGLISDDSDVFSIIVPSITITAPAAGTVWVKDSVKTITWIKQGTQDANVKIQLYKGLYKKLDITLSTENDGSFEWDIPSTLVTASNYTVRVITLDGKVKGKSAEFTITTGRMQITAPAAGEAWQRGVAHTITWTMEGTLNSHVKIQLFKGITLVSTLSTSTENDGSFEWLIPAGQVLSSKYKVRVKTVDGLVKADSGRFTIGDSAGLTLMSPNGGETLKAGKPYEIRWSEDPSVLEVKLEYSRDNGGSFTTIADHLEDIGRYEWFVPVSLTSNAVVRVADASGRPWQEDGLLEYTFRFSYIGSDHEAGMQLWFGSNDVNAPSFGFGRIDIGNQSVTFGGMAKAVGPLAGSWHELRVRLDLRRDLAGIWLDDDMLFENAALNTTRERYFEQGLALEAGGEQGMEMELDDLAIRVVRQDELGEDRQAFTVLRDDFERYDAKANPIVSCWQLPVSLEDGSNIELNLDALRNKSLRLRTGAGKRIMLRLPFSLPDKVPFDISDKNVVIEN